MTLPKLSIAAKLYAIFALMAITTVMLSAAAIVGTRSNAVLAAQLESANTGSRNMERINSLLSAMLEETRDTTKARDRQVAATHAQELAELNDRIGSALTEWQASMPRSDAAVVRNLAVQIGKFRNFVPELVRIATEQGPEEARILVRQFHPDEIRKALAENIETLSQQYTELVERLYRVLDDSIHKTARLLSLVEAFAVLLAIAGVLTIMRGVVRPITEITRVIESVAAGNAAMVVPFGERNDEIGALARSITVFQDAIRHNEELNQAVVGDAQQRTQRQEQMSAEIARFSADVEATLAELGRISDQMLAASSQLAGVADDASDKTARAAAASAEASGNVRDIASAADELSTSVTEIDRQVAQSNAVATKAVNEAERTNIAVKELNEAAARIGDVVKLITDIAEQTNLLALNATIEAARAGEAGRGFAVVAGEVKALAGQTSRATEEIATQIAGMQRATTRSIEAINSIEAIIREIGDISGAIAAAVTEQGAATAEIARSVEIAAKRTVETAAEINLVGSATEDTRTSAGTAKAVADDLGSVAGRIRAQVDQFFERLSA